MHGGLVDQSAKFKKRVASKDISNYRVVYTNELVVGFPIDEGVLGFQTKYRAAAVSPSYGIWMLRRPADTHIPFIESYLRSSEARKKYAQKMRGAVARRRSINRDDFLEIQIPFPPLHEQKRIAAILEKADALCRQRRDSLQLTEKLLQSIFLDMFGDPAKLPQSKFIDLLNKPLRNGLSPSSAGTHSGTVLTLSAISQGLFDSTARKDAKFSAPPKPAARIDKADFLICRGSGSLKLCGQGQFPTDDAAGIIFPDTIIAASIDLTRVSKAYFGALWNQTFIRKQLEGGARTANGIYKVNQTTLENIQIPVPEPETQVEFERTAQAIASRRTDLEASIKYTESLFSSLQQRAFRGELDLSRLVLDPTDNVPPEPEPQRRAAGAVQTGMALLLHPSLDIEVALVSLDEFVRKGKSIPWSADYFKYRVLGEQPGPFSFDDVMQKAKSVFDEPPYEEMKDMILELLGQGGGHALLHQSFDLHIDDKTKEASGRKEILFGPAA